MAASASSRSPDFLRQSTAPDTEPVTYANARDFLVNASRQLSAEAAHNLLPMARRYLAQFATALDSAIQDTADSAGLGDVYRSAIDEYRGAMKLNDTWEATEDVGKEILTKGIQSVPWIGAAYAIAKKHGQ